MRASILGRGLLGVVAGLFFALPETACAGRSVNVALRASFDSAPYLLELLETAAEENETSYFPVLDRIAEGYFADASTDEELYRSFLDLLQKDGHITDPATLSSFNYALSIRSAAPRVDAHFQFYNTSVEPSLMVAQDAACPVWVYFEKKQYCSPAFERSQQDVNDNKAIQELPFDRRTGPSNAPPAILYADIMSPLFGDFHKHLRRSASSGEISYRLRYRAPLNVEPKPLFVNGYGVELALKRTDYIVIDDRNAEADASKQDVSPDDLSLPDKESESFADLKPLSASDVVALGTKASSFVMNSEDQFETLLKLSQDFPKHSAKIAAYNVSSDFMTEFQENRDIFLPPGYNVLWINGVQISPRQVDAFSLLELLRKERALVNEFRQLGFNGSQAVELLSYPSIYESVMNDEPQRYDYRDEVEGGDIIMWLNNLEKDKRYADWPSELENLLTRTYPGQLPSVRRDLHNVIVPVDFSNEDDVDLVIEGLQRFVKQRIPVRFGMVPVLGTKAAENMAKVIYYLVDNYGLGASFSYLQAILRNGKLPKANGSIFKSVTEQHNLRKDGVETVFEEVLRSTELDERLSRTKKYLQRLGADGENPPVFANGMIVPKNEQWLRGMSARVNSDLQAVKRAISSGLIKGDFWLPEYYLADASPRRNAMIAPEDETDINIVNINELYRSHEAVLSKLPVLSGDANADRSEKVQVIVVADFDAQDGVSILQETLKFMEEYPGAEIILVHNSGLQSSKHCLSYSLGLMSTKPNLGVPEVRNLLEQGDQTCDDDSDEFQKVKAFWSESRPLIETLGLGLGQQGISLNGRVIGPIPSSLPFTADDFGYLLKYEQIKRLQPVLEALDNMGFGEKLNTPLQISKITSLVGLSFIPDAPKGIFDAPPKGRARPFDKWNSTFSAITRGDTQDPSIYIVAALDPTNEMAQKYLPILKVLSELNGVNLKVFLNPRVALQELPIKRFYRYVLHSKPIFDENGSLYVPKASFSGVPQEALLNLGMDVPPSWLVSPKESIYDLDNIKLSSIPDGTNVDAIIELESILIEGHSRETETGMPPRGVQLILGTQKQPLFADTIVMSNIGYFQFKAKPGYWKIQLKNGPSKKIFDIDTLDWTGSSSNDTDVVLMSFQGKTLYPLLSRKPGQEEADVLDEITVKGNPAADIVSKGLRAAQGILSNLGVSQSRNKAVAGGNADINIFSVASGHLYERMLNIMMVSVMKHTTHTVKFWFIEQFLSPSFKAFLPHLAAHYHFSFEMVTYKWPHWLRAQREKQREIWGYKILFLDVLFPLSLDKVIFVDADQIVRTDMYELVTLDLQGAPYGFTPMCDSRTEMEGFRFWKQGYWKTYLRGLPYHISALYVVDLVRFRQIAAGDRLRQQYQMLSADPESLSNLDQDLPNNMQSVLPIHSLPQEWLWCETWCSDESLGQAKTIDLCNNPLTKEPKLDRARRQVPEWTEYDEEIASLARQVKEAEAEAEAEAEVSDDEDKVKHEEL